MVYKNLSRSNKKEIKHIYERAKEYSNHVKSRKYSQYNSSVNIETILITIKDILQSVDYVIFYVHTHDVKFINSSKNQRSIKFTGPLQSHIIIEEIGDEQCVKQIHINFSL